MQPPSTYRVDMTDVEFREQVDKGGLAWAPLLIHGNLWTAAPAQIDPATQAHIRACRKNTRCRCLRLAPPRRVWLRDGVGYRTADYEVGMLVTDRAHGVLTTPFRYIDYALKRIKLLRHHNVEPFFVFDGGPLPAKTGTEEDREKYVKSSRAAPGDSA
jgi:hypothetical protein